MGCPHDGAEERARDRERQRLLATISGVLDRETGAQARREVLVRALVTEGLVDIARLIEIVDDGRAVVRAVAGPTPEVEQVLAALDGGWGLPRDVLAGGEPHLAVVDDAYIAASSSDPGQRALRRRLDMCTVALVPLAARGRVVGLLATARQAQSRPQDADDLALLAEIGRRAATALDNVLLLERERETSRRLELLQQATAALSAAATPVQVAGTVVAQFEQLLGTRSVAVWEVRETGILEALDLGGWDRTAQRDWVSLPIDTSSPAGAAAFRREPAWVETVADWEREYPRLLPMVQGYGYTTIDCLPLLSGGRCLGVVAVGFAEERLLTAAERVAVQALTDQCAQALQRAGLLAAESGARRAAEEFGDVVAALSGASTPSEVAAVILGYTAGLGAESAVVLLRGADRAESLQVLAASGPAAPAVRAGERRFPIDSAHPLAHAVRTGEPVWVGIRSQWAWQDRRFSADETVLPAQVAVPLVLGGTALGVIGMRFGDEVPVWTADQRATVLTLAGQYAQALDRARLHQAEHEVAEVLQRSLLPRALPTLARLDAAARYLPGAVGSQAGGDWYDLLPVGDTRVALAVGDVVGQGPPAAAVMGQLRSALAGYLLDGHSPAAALERLDRFAALVEGATGSTCACLTLDWRTGELCWAGAGHLPVLLIDAAGARFLSDGAGTVLGVRGRPPFQEACATIAPGASVVLYTDGLVERRDEVVDDGLALLARTAEALTDRDPDTLATGLVHGILDDVAPADDVALVVVRLIPEPLRERLPAAATALRGLRRAVAGWCAAAGLPEESAEDLQLVLGEAAANAAEHAYPASGGEFDYRVARTDDGAVEVRVRDFGIWRPEPADNGFRGRGLAMIRELGERVVIDTGPGGTEVGFRLPAPRRTGVPPARSARPLTGTAGQPATLTVSAPDPAAGVRVLRLHGDLDLDGVRAVRDAVLVQLAGTARVVVDLGEVGYLSSAGVGLLAEAAAAAGAAGTALSVRAEDDSPAARILHLTGLDRVLPVDVHDDAAARS